MILLREEMAGPSPSISPSAKGSDSQSLNQAQSEPTRQALDLVEKLPTSAVAGLVLPKPVSAAYDLYRVGTELYNAAVNQSPAEHDRWKTAHTGSAVQASAAMANRNLGGLSTFTIGEVPTPSDSEIHGAKSLSTEAASAPNSVSAPRR